MKLVEITEDNIYDIMALQLKPKQANFVRDPIYSLAESYCYRDDDTVRLFALEEQGTVVGFLSLMTDIEDQVVHIWRMMIGSQYQSKGYGRNALRTIEDYVSSLEEYEKIVSDYVEGNLAMKHLLKTEGYVEAGKQEEWNEIIMIKELVH
ncbi:GNAT family N-acetyltransferase [Aerococcaceae bacterium DSM 111020]|nr:GNAT family N-acetyltransferase [Aerococcaceae bacterium DSM 111020]